MRLDISQFATLAWLRLAPIVTVIRPSRIKLHENICKDWSPDSIFRKLKSYLILVRISITCVAGGQRIKAGFHYRRSRSRYRKRRAYDLVKTAFRFRLRLRRQRSADDLVQTRCSRSRKQKRKNWTIHKACERALWLIHEYERIRFHSIGSAY